MTKLYKEDGGSIICNHQLTPDQLLSLEQLRTQCQVDDGATIPIYGDLLRKHRQLPCNILYYQQQRLIGFLSLFFFYQDACEICLLVAPPYRRQGIARHLLQQIIPIICANQLSALLFPSPYPADMRWLTAYGLAYEKSEYEMQRNHSAPLPIALEIMQVRKATVQDLDTLVCIDQACFPATSAHLTTRLQKLLQDPNYSLYLAIVDQEAIGKAHVRWLSNAARFSDVAILPQAQGRGWGRALLSHCINNALLAKKPQCILEVETHNAQALKLYLSLGFTIHNACHYWGIAVKKFLQHFDGQENAHLPSIF